MTTYTDLGITYTIDPTELTAVVSGALTDINGARTILSSVDISDLTYFVTSIGQDAFKDCDTLTSITIPASVTSIEAGAFDGCSTLAEIIFENAELSILGADIFVGATAITLVLLTITNLTLNTNILALQSQISGVSSSVVYIYRYSSHGITYTTDNDLDGSITSVVTSLLTVESDILNVLTIGNQDAYTTYDVTTIASSVKSQHTGLTDATITDDPNFFSARALDFRYIMSTMPLEYYTSEFETSIATIKATIYEQITTPTVSRTATSTIPYDSIKNAFQYLPGDATDPMFRLVLGADYPHLGFSTSEATVINGSVSGNVVTIGTDWLHNLSKYTFGTWDQGDKFLNGTVASNLDPSFKTAFKAILDTEASLAETIPFKSSSVVKNIYDKILYYDSQRLNDKEVLATTEDVEQWLIVPVAVGDKISFLVTVTAHLDQVIEGSAIVLQSRDYLFEALVVN